MDITARCIHEMGRALSKIDNFASDFFLIKKEMVHLIIFAHNFVPPSL